jgi:hypothetical protein
MDKFFDYQLDPVPRFPNALNSLSYKVLHGHDYSMLKFSVKHFADFYRGLKKLSLLFSGTELPPQMQFYIDRINKGSAGRAHPATGSAASKHQIIRRTKPFLHPLFKYAIPQRFA